MHIQEAYVERLTVQGRWKISTGIALQLVSVALIASCGSYMQEIWGVTGLIATELMLLMIALITTVAYKTPLKEVFPVKPVSAREAIGLILFILGGYLMNIVMLGISVKVISSASGETSYVNAFLSGYDPVLLFVSMALLPALCEEALERGVVMKHFRSIKKDWVIVLIMGLFFGLFHLSPGRFLNTACLGALLSYLMLKKENILFPVIFHFANNLISILPSLFSFGNAASEVDPSELTYVYLLMGCLFPVLLVAGNMLMCPGAFRKRQWIAAALASVVLLTAGIADAFLVRGRVVDDKVYVLQETLRKEYTVEVRQDGLYFVKISSSYRGACELRQDGVRSIAGSRKGNSEPCIVGFYRLSAGTYTVTYEVWEGSEDEVDLDATLIRIYK